MVTGNIFLRKLITPNRNKIVFVLLCICISYIALPVVESEYILFNIRNAYEKNDSKYLEKIIEKDTNFYYEKSNISGHIILKKMYKNINSHSFIFNNIY